jgi:hypothetical protein
MSFGENFLTYPDLFPARPSGEPWGDERVMIRFAGHVYAWTGLSATQAAAARQRFGALCLPPDEEPPAVLEINVFRAAAEDFFDGGRIWSFEFDLDYAPDAVSIAGFHFMGRLDWTPGLRAALWTSEDSRLVSHSIFENFFRTVVAYHLFEQGGVLLHSAAVVNDGDAYVFFGPSGAGKSTISHLSFAAGHAVLSDDLNALRVTAEGVWVEKLPFAGDFGQTAGGADGAYPVRALCRLHKGADPALQVLRPAAAVAALLGCAPFVNRNPYRRDQLFDQLQALNVRLPVRTLTFARDDRFWALLRSGENS